VLVYFFIRNAGRQFKFSTLDVMKPPSLSLCSVCRSHSFNSCQETGLQIHRNIGRLSFYVRTRSLCIFSGSMACHHLVWCCSR